MLSILSGIVGRDIMFLFLMASVCNAAFLDVSTLKTNVAFEVETILYLDIPGTKITHPIKYVSMKKDDIENVQKTLSLTSTFFEEYADSEGIDIENHVGGTLIIYGLTSRELSKVTPYKKWVFDERGFPTSGLNGVIVEISNGLDEHAILYTINSQFHDKKFCNSQQYWTLSHELFHYFMRFFGQWHIDEEKMAREFASYFYRQCRDNGFNTVN
jgi:hypothetical protein